VESVGLSVRLVEPDDLVTMADIAHRLGKSREYIRLLANGRKGRGLFPKPISHVSGRSKLWHWSDVAAWAGLADQVAEHARSIAAINAALELRRAEPDSENRKRLLRAVGAY
jgi:predicted DNA-binding transcriptional regulator AlpA